MASAIARRAICQQAILNISELVENGGYLGLNIHVLQSNLRYLKRNFYSFRAAHVKVTSVLSTEEIEQQTTILAKIESCYVTTLNQIQQRIGDLKEALQNPRAFAVEQEHAVNEETATNVSDSSESDRNDTPELSEERSEQPSAASVTQLQSQLQQQLQPIVLQLQGVGKVENTWGDFDGHLSKWKSFHDRFKVAVHENDTIAKVFKFQHLCNSLKGYAATSINNWEQTEDNYDEAWARLKELYNRPYETTNELYDRFENLTKLDKPTGGLLQKMSNITHEVVRQLRALGISVEHLDSYFVNGIRKKLDGDTCKQWELLRSSLPNAQNPKLADVLSFVETQAKAMFAVTGMATRDNRKRQVSEKEQPNVKKFRSNDNNSAKTEQKGNISHLSA